MVDKPLFRGLLLIGLLLLVLPLLMMSFMMLMMGGMMSGMGGMRFFSFIPLSLVLVAIYAGYRLVQTAEENGESGADTEANPVEHLQEQYVEGEITEAEFERRLDQHYESTDGSESTNRTSFETAKRHESESERES